MQCDSTHLSLEMHEIPSDILLVILDHDLVQIDRLLRLDHLLFLLHGLLDRIPIHIHIHGHVRIGQPIVRPPCWTLALILPTAADRG